MEATGQMRNRVFVFDPYLRESCSLNKENAFPLFYDAPNIMIAGPMAKSPKSPTPTEVDHFAHDAAKQKHPDGGKSGPCAG